VYGAEKVSSTKRRQFQVRLNRVRQAVTTWLDADCQRAIERFEREIHQVTPAKCKYFNKLFQHHERQLLQKVGTKETGPRSVFAKQHTLLKTAVKDNTYGVANITIDNQLQFQIRLSDAETDSTTWSLADPGHVTIQLEKEIYIITLNEQKQFKKEFSIRFIEFEAWWETIGIQALRKTIEQCVIHFRYGKVHLVINISESIRRMGSSDNCTTDISTRLNIANVKEAYRSNNKVNYIRQIHKHNVRCNSLDYMEETLSYLALQGWYDIDSAKVFNLLSAQLPRPHPKNDR